MENFPFCNSITGHQITTIFSPVILCAKFCSGQFTKIWMRTKWNFSQIWIVMEKSLTHWGRVTHLCVSKLTSIASDNGLSPGRRQAIIWTNAGILLIGPLGTNFSEIFSEIHTFSFKKMRLKISSGKWRPFCVGLNVLMKWTLYCLSNIFLSPWWKTLFLVFLFLFFQNLNFHQRKLFYWLKPMQSYVTFHISSESYR